MLGVYRSWEAELPHMALNASLSVYHGLIVELHLHPFSSSFHAVPPVRDGDNSTRKQRSLWDNFLSCPKIAGCLPVSGSQLRHVPAPFVTGEAASVLLVLE